MKTKIMVLGLLIVMGLAVSACSVEIERNADRWLAGRGIEYDWRCSAGRT
jgi:hypothetical protein